MSAGTIETKREPTVHEPYRNGLPPIRSYFREFWRRRHFAIEFARTELKGRNMDTLFGQAWHILNPLLLGLVYYLLLTFLQPGKSGGLDRVAFLLCGLFAFFYSRNCMQMGAQAVVGGSGLLLNSAFPRLLLPSASVISAMLAHASALVVYAAVHIATGQYMGPVLLYLVPLLVIQTVINLGLALVVATMTVYFRDINSFLPYVLRIWMYLTPVLFFRESLPARWDKILQLNPLFTLLGSWQEVLLRGVAPSPKDLGQSIAWAVVLFFVGMYAFLARERDFALRI